MQKHLFSTFFNRANKQITGEMKDASEGKKNDEFAGFYENN